MKIEILLPAIAIVCGLSGCATIPSTPRASQTSDSGYFLSMRQKGQLIGTGRIQDANGIWYDVWVVPGYVQPARRTKKYVQRTYSDFAEYVQPKKYHDLSISSNKALDRAYDTLNDFTIKGVSRAWNRYWSAANRRTSQRVFGWWLAYPWALMVSSVDTVVRVPVGLTGSALCTVWGVAVVPGYYAINSAAKGSWHFAVDAVLFPIAACTWNTVVAPPLAIVGQKPDPSRVDGFWVKQIDNKTMEISVTSKDIEVLAVWGRLLLTASQPYEDLRGALRKQIQSEYDAINRKSQAAETDIREQEETAVRSIVVTLSQQETLDYLGSRGFGSRRISQMSGDISRYLRDVEKLSPEEITRVLFLLKRYPLPVTSNQLPLRSKTDPVQRSIDVLKEIQ